MMLNIICLCVLLSVLTITETNFVCQKNGFFENILDSKTFWHCIYGNAYLKPCPTDLYWSTVEQRCIPIDVTTTTIDPLPSQCYNYTSITDGTRHVNHLNMVQEKDGAMFNATAVWVRFEGSAGTRLADYSVPLNRCGSETVAWAKETIEPSVGKTINQTICLNWKQMTCIWPMKIPMTHCQNYFVYALSAPAIPEARFCTI